ncbi:MAG TPA: hypothetical protein VL946_13950, partial [Lacibacter sp.]|nr:hypothetical protein [Lacibacter sp.]
MKHVILFFAVTLMTTSAFSQTTIHRDPEIEKMVKEISPDSLKAHVLKMVSFGTRHTMSTVTDQKNGIGAAREWVVAKFKEFAKQSKGRMTAFVDTTTLQPDGRRISKPVNLGNAMA